MKDWSEIYDLREGTYQSSFRMYNPQAYTKGDTYTDTEQSWCNLMLHESEFDVIETLKHEDRHTALKREDFNDDVEHEILKRLAWVENGLINLV